MNRAAGLLFMVFGLAGLWAYNTGRLQQIIHDLEGPSPGPSPLFSSPEQHIGSGPLPPWLPPMTGKPANPLSVPAPLSQGGGGGTPGIGYTPVE